MRCQPHPTDRRALAISITPETHEAAIQLPVVPLVKRWNACVGGHYMDEFAEMHGKEVPVRALATGIR